MWDLISHLRHQLDWSLRTFGPGKRTGGVLAHIRKELVEIERAPLDLTEWVDVLMLAFDGAMRAGYTPQMVCAALEAKLLVNEARQWPDWWLVDENTPIEHIHKSKAPIVTRRACDSGCRYYATNGVDEVCEHPRATKHEGGWLPIATMRQRELCAPPDLKLWEMQVNATTEEGELING